MNNSHAPNDPIPQTEPNLPPPPLSGMTPAEGWRLLNVGEFVRKGDEVYTCDEDGANWDLVDEGFYLEPVLGDDPPIRRRLDPSLDPLTPLREELRKAHELLSEIICEPDMYLTRKDIREAKEWLTRNAAFGQKGGE